MNKIKTVLNFVVTVIIRCGVAMALAVGLCVLMHLNKAGITVIVGLSIITTAFDIYCSKQSDCETIKIKYLSNKISKLRYVGGSKKSNWIDLRVAERVELKAGESKLIPLGVAMQIPDGYEAHLVPRSSTYKNFGIIQTNHTGIIDSSYCGANDQWFFSAKADRDTVINVNDRICQFRIVKNQPSIKFIEDDLKNNSNRGGFGTTGKV